ncbi:MAG: hypothetical protein ACUZ8E_17625 [Candidatus Anammoxibacter sp.]
MTLSKNIEKGQRIKIASGWRKIKAVTNVGAVVNGGLVPFGSTILGWKAK